MGKKIVQKITVQKGRETGSSTQGEALDRANKSKNPKSRLYTTKKGHGESEFTNVEREDAIGSKPLVGPAGMTVYVGQKKDKKAPAYRKPKK